MPNRWRWSEVKACEVSKAAHERGYGTLDEVWPQHVSGGMSRARHNSVFE
jgi:hypothetical protein